MKKLHLAISIILFLSGCTPKYTFFADAKMQNYRMQPAADTIKADASTKAVENLIAPFRNGMAQQMDEIVGTTVKELTYGSTQSLMGNWACETILSQVPKFFGKKADFVTSNQGGFRIRSMPKGNITVGKIFEIMPFDNQLILVETPGEVVKQFCDYLAVRGGWPLAGIKFEIVNKKYAQNIRIGGEPLDLNKKYVVGISDYIANGGDKCLFFKNLKREDNAILLRKALIEGARDQTRAGKFLDADLDDRIVLVSKE